MEDKAEDEEFDGVIDIIGPVVKTIRQWMTLRTLNTATDVKYSGHLLLI